MTTTIYAKRLVAALTGALGAISTEKCEPLLCAVHLVQGEHGLIVEATDRFRLAYTVIPNRDDNVPQHDAQTGTETGFDVLLPTASVRSLISWLKQEIKSNKRLSVVLSAGEDADGAMCLVVTWSAPSTETIFVNAIEGHFPNLAALLKQETFTQHLPGDPVIGLNPRFLKTLSSVPVGRGVSWKLTLVGKKLSFGGGLSSAVRGEIYDEIHDLNWVVLLMGTRLA